LSISKLNWKQPIEIQSCWDMKVILRYRYLFNLPFSAIKIDEPPRHSQGAESPWSEQLKVRLNPPTSKGTTASKPPTSGQGHDPEKPIGIPSGHSIHETLARMQ